MADDWFDAPARFLEKSAKVSEYEALNRFPVDDEKLAKIRQTLRVLHDPSTRGACNWIWWVIVWIAIWVVSYTVFSILGMVI